MSSIRMKKDIRAVFESHSRADPYEIRRIFNEVLREIEIEKGWDEQSRNRPWADDELRVILNDAPTKENCLKHAKAFGRGYGAIEQIYRWAATSDREIARKRPNDAFVKQIKRVAKQLAWRAG